MGDKCTACGKSVFAMEKVSACGKAYHNSCLRCGVCKKVLRNGNWEDKGGVVYCTPCYSEKFVDDDTKNIIWEMENSHAKVVSGSAKAMPGMGGSAPPPSRKPPMPSPTSAPPPQPAGPRKALGSALQNDIISRSGNPKGPSRGLSSPAPSAPKRSPAPPPPRGAAPPSRGGRAW